MRRWRVLVAGAVLGATGLLPSCAVFADQPPPEAWKPREQLTPQGGPQPSVPGESDDAPDRQDTPPSEIPPPDGCVDYNPAVIGTCMDTVLAVAALPGDGSSPAALVGERDTGRILRVRIGQDPVVVATIPVDATGGGGLTGLALSPSYAEDRLIFAYITTRTDNRLVRLAEGESAKPVVTGIPRGSSGNRGALAADRQGALLLATGDAGSPTAATDPRSMAGKVLRLNGSGLPAPGNPTAGSAIVASGVHSPGGICAPMGGGPTWLTDQVPGRDLLYRLDFGRPLATPAWSWLDRPGVAGCAATADAVAVATTRAANLQLLPLAPDGTFSGKPQVSLAGKEGFGRLGGMDLVNEAIAVAGTTNKDGGKPVSSDDRAVLIVPTLSGGRGAD